MQALVAQNVRDHRGVAETETQEGEAGKTAGAEAGRTYLPGSTWRGVLCSKSLKMRCVADPMIQEQR